MTGERTPGTEYAEQALHTAIDLPGSRDLLDEERLGALVGRAVRITRIRIKAGTSVTVAWRARTAAPATGARTLSDPGDAQPVGGTDGAPLLEDIGWAALFASPDKVENTRRRAEATGGRLEAADGSTLSGTDGAPGADGDAPQILAGAATTDPRVGRALAKATGRGDLTGARVLSWNPLRRLVLRLRTGDVLRVDPTGMQEILRAEQLLLGLGVPTLTSRALDSKRRLLLIEGWGIGDLAGRPDPSAAHEIGALIARMHGGAEATSGGSLPAARIGELIPDAATAMGAVLRAIPAPATDEQAPGPDRRDRQGSDRQGSATLADRAIAVARATAATLTAAPGPDALIHGDLSPDQVLIGEDGQLRLIDLDRTGRGPIGADLGTWIAACENLDHPDGPALADAFLDGYRSAGGTIPQALQAWIARAHLAAALEPLRRWRPDWPALVAARLDRAARALEAQILAAGPGSDRASKTGDADHPGPAVPKIPEDPDLPGLARALAPGGLAEGATLIGHKPGRRAVLRTPAGDYVKVVRAGRTKKILRALDRAAAFDGPFVMPQVIASDDELVATSPVPGRSLHEAGAFTDEEWERACADVMRAWLQAARDSEQPFLAAVAAGQEPHGVEAERAVLTRWRLEAREAGEDLQREEAVHAADARLAELAEPRTVTTVHRDLHDKQLLWSAEHGAGLIDVDTACPGDPAVDLGNLRAHADWRVTQGLWTGDRAAVLRAAIDEAASDLGVPAERVAVFEQATVTRLACVYAVRGSAEDAARARSRAARQAEVVEGS